MLPFAKREGVFLNGEAPFEEAKVVLMGVPLELTVGFCPGTRFGPELIRFSSRNLETYSPYLHRDLQAVPFCDVGNLSLPPGNLSRAFERIEAAVTTLCQAEKIPLLMGGEHLITYPSVCALKKSYPELLVLQFDAHADLREEDEGERFTHATVMRRVLEVTGEKRLFQVGIRSGCRQEFEFAAAHTYLYLSSLKEALLSLLPLLKGRPTYLTFDIDVVDPAYAPGTGAPEPGGCSPQEIFTALTSLAGLKVVGFDLVEVAPNRDLTERTALLAAKIIREAILAFW